MEDMSLFPAYNKDVSDDKLPNRYTESSKQEWLENPSFNESEPVFYAASSTSVNINDDESKTQKVGKTKHKEKKHKIDQKKKIKIDHEFTGKEEYYVDRAGLKSYLTMQTLHRPACPRYKTKCSVIGHHAKDGHKSFTRYFNKEFRHVTNTTIPTNTSEALSEEEFTYKNKDFHRKLTVNPRNIETWIKYVEHQNLTPFRLTKTMLAERKIEIIERALVHNTSNEMLYNLFVEIIDSTYPSFEVSKLLDKLQAKDPTNYILWSAQINATQASMARCIVPDVLKLYEDCMQKMYRKSQKDEITMKLFKGVALFLRQAGLNEQFFALIKLALELNISNDKLERIQPSEADQQTLIEYEEVILKSGLPMNEIWLRIEKLRQNFNFLPCPTTANCSDPQRIVFNEDICYFIYPLAKRENCFVLVILIFSLLKIPFLWTSSLKDNFLFKIDNFNEFDSIEDMLAVCLYQTTNFGSNSLIFDTCLFELAKDIATSPTYLNTNIGYEIYLNTIIEILLLIGDSYSDENRIRTVFFILWLRLERLLIILLKINNKITIDYIKKVKNKIKNQLKKAENRNILNFYTEYALIEYEMKNLNTAENVFIKSICEGDSSVPNSDFCNAYVTYSEILLKNRNYNKAIKVLTCYALDISLEELDGNILNESRKLLALNKFTERLNNLIFIEKKVKIMELEQYFLPDYLVSLIKAKIYYQVLICENFDAIYYLDELLLLFSEDNKRHKFIRENIHEIIVKIIQWPDKICYASNRLIYERIEKALKEFPDNLIILKTASTLDGQAWYKIRRLLMKQETPLATLFLIASAHYRFHCQNKIKNNENLYQMLSSDIDSNEKTYKQRIGNLLNEIIEKSTTLRKNPILWRLYLRSLCDLQASFEKCKNTLFTAMDECPWHKALYLDGSIFVPQELPQIQDLLIEKQLRIYALPEELEILRNDSFTTPASN